MGLAASEEELDAVARNFIDELELRNTRPLDPDLFALFLDAKYVEVREGDRLRPGPRRQKARSGQFVPLRTREPRGVEEHPARFDRTRPAAPLAGGPRRLLRPAAHHPQLVPPSRCPALYRPSATQCQEPLHQDRRG